MTVEMRPEPLVISRILRAPRERVFQAWSHADHVKRWFAPEGCTAPEAEVDFRPGGVFNIVMEVPGGIRHTIRANFTDIVAPERLGFAGVVESNGKPAFRVETDVKFESMPEGSKLTVTQAYVIYDPVFINAIAGAERGWSSTLSNLEREALALPIARSVAHGQFTVRRSYAATPQALFRAFADPDAKAKWFSRPGGFDLLERRMDVRPGGTERVSGRWPTGMISTFDATYLDVVPNERLIYVYEMQLDGRKISASLATLTFSPDPRGSQLVITEQGVFLDGYDDSGSREKGTRDLLDAVGRSLDD